VQPVKIFLCGLRALYLDPYEPREVARPCTGSGRGRGREGALFQGETFITVFVLFRRTCTNVSCKHSYSKQRAVDGFLDSRAWYFYRNLERWKTGAQIVRHMGASSPSNDQGLGRRQGKASLLDAAEVSESRQFVAIDALNLLH
jgi:hypothetical protein